MLAFGVRSNELLGGALRGNNLEASRDSGYNGSDWSNVKRSPIAAPMVRQALSANWFDASMVGLAIVQDH